MIHYNPDATQLPKEVLEIAQVCPGLESLTGADILVTPSRIPTDSDALIKAHLINGAVLIQLKIGHDFTSSVGVRLHTSLARMLTITRYTWQRVLVVIGTPLPDGQGLATMSHLRYTEHGKPYTLPQPQTGTHVTYPALVTAKVHWSTCGGAGPFFEPDESSFLHLLRVYERAYAEPIKQVMPDKLKLYEETDDPLQTLQRVSDEVELIAALRGRIGIKKAQAVLKQWGNVATAFAYLSSPRLFASVPEQYPVGIGIKTVEGIHDQFGGEVEPRYFPEQEF